MFSVFSFVFLVFFLVFYLFFLCFSRFFFVFLVFFIVFGGGKKDLHPKKFIHFQKSFSFPFSFFIFTFGVREKWRFWFKTSKIFGLRFIQELFPFPRTAEKEKIDPKDAVLVKMAAAPVNPSDFGSWKATGAEFKEKVPGNSRRAENVSESERRLAWQEV